MTRHSEMIRARHGPLALLEHRLDSFDNAWVCLADLLRLQRCIHAVKKSLRATEVVRSTYGEILEGTGLLDVGKGSLEILELCVDFLRGLLRLRDLLFPLTFN